MQTLIGKSCIGRSNFLRFSSFFESYSVYLILLSVVLLQLIVSKAGIEISDRSIRVKTILSPFMGSTTHALTSVDSIEVRKNKVSRLAYCFSFILGMYSASKSVSNIRIRFLPHPFVNKITIHTTNAGQIADLIEKARNRKISHP